MKKILIIVWIETLLVSAFVLFAAAAFAQGSPQQDEKTGTVKIAANTTFNKAGKFKRLMFGDHYRKEWATPVDIEVLDMDDFAGGLTPVKMGGGLQTKSLRLKGADGKTYVLRSVNKEVSKAIVEELRGTFAEDIVQDQISSSNPYAPMVVASLAQSAGIFHSTPHLVYVTNSERLGDYAVAFGETLCLLEERPSDSDEGNPEYGNSKNIVNSSKLLEKVVSKINHQVDEKAYVKARLFDMMIGDWDRHEDQWLWASFKVDGNTIYKPIPRDRDQAFSNLDGLIPAMATRKWGVRKLQHFDYTIRDIYGLNSNGAHLDRNFTTRLELNDWLVAARELQETLTNEVIAAAFREMPDPIYNISGKETVAKLRRRRDDLAKYAKEYYLFLSEEVNITGTSDQEFFQVIRINDDSTKVTVYNVADNKAGDRRVYERIFLRSETKEIRLYGLDGNDLFHITGSTDKGILIRVIGGKDKDLITDSSSVKGGAHLTKIYDDGNNKFKTGRETRKYISTDTLKNEYNRKSFRFDWLAPVQKPGYNPDDGLYLGGGLVYKKQQFGKSPYGYMHSFSGNYAFKTGAYTFSYQGIFKEFAGKWDLQLDAQINAPNYSRNYFGLGNETENLDMEKNYYRVRYDQVIVGSSLKRQFGSKHSVDIGSGFQSIKIENTEDRFISTGQSKLDSSDFDRKNYGDAHINYQFSTINNPLYPTKGVSWKSGVSYTSNLKDHQTNFAKVSSEIAFYSPLGRFTLATRTGVEANLGDDYEFFQANTLGNSTNLRGYRKDRFAGKTAVYSNTELRYSMGYMNAYFVKGSWGLLGFFDNGRVWIPGEDSDKWHNGYGGGVWFLPFNKMALTATYGISKEDRLVSVSAGFLF